ncbi:MAG: TlpA family protein disulfide reductase [Holophagaceae bacterium]|nr:TlpA family protein disulfide reductase [Holophagaceae bacterium]
MTRKLFILPLALLAGLAVQAQSVSVEKHTGYNIQTSEGFAGRIGQTFPEFEFTDLNGKVWKSKSLRGKVVYLNFWFTGCPPCIQEIPSINAVYKHYINNPDVVMLSIDGFESSDVIKSFLKKHPIDLPISTIKMKELMTLAGNNGNIGFPTHILIDRDWRLVIAASGGNSTIGESIQKDIESILLSKSTPALKTDEPPQTKK